MSRYQALLTDSAPPSWQIVRQQLQSGDILLCSGEGLTSRLIREATGSIFSHVGLILKLAISDQWLVLESVETKGVRCVSLAEGYLSNYNGNGAPYPGQLFIARHRCVKAKAEYLPIMYQRAFSLLGDHYNEKAIFEIAARIGMKKIGIHPNGDLQPGHRYICSEFVYACFQSLNIKLAFDPAGFIAPADLANDPEVEPLFHLPSTDALVLPEPHTTVA